MIDRIKLILILIPFLQYIVVPMAQAQRPITGHAGCSYYGQPARVGIYGFGSDKKARLAVERIMQHTGLPQNFEIMAANVANAQARLEGSTRLILYNQEFMERVKRRTRTDWAAVSILAHEIGHHLSGHTLTMDGSRPKTELEADRFSGHVLYKMGAKLRESKAAMEAVASDTGSSTHPPKSARLAAIANGWYSAQEQDKPPESRQKESRRSPTPARERRQEPRQQVRHQYFATCQFNDGTMSAVLHDNTIVLNYMGMTIPVARRMRSDDRRFAWKYVINSADPMTEMYMNMLGMSAQTWYGVDDDGAIWAPNVFGGLVQVGRVTYH